jgi:hypothetical protein
MLKGENTLILHKRSLLFNMMLGYHELAVQMIAELGKGGTSAG